jgi:hypothetical protein
VNSKLRWIARPLGDPDVGLDAEIEVVSDSGMSTGKLLRVQIKTTEDSFSISSIKTLYFDDDHLNYWIYYSVPVIFCAVSLADYLILWREICPGASRPLSRASNAISFDLTADLLGIDSKTPLDRIAMGSVAPARDLVSEVCSRISEYEANRCSGVYDIVSYGTWAGLFGNYYDKVRNAVNVIKASRITTMEEKMSSTETLEKLGRYSQEAAYVAANCEWPDSGDF